MNETQTLQRIESRQLDSPMTVNDLLAQVNLIQEVMGKVMKDKEHYGVIPGCGNKPALLQPGAQKLLVTFRLAPDYDIDERQLDRGHREYRVTCTLKTIGSGSFVGQGAGAASTMESKWRFRVAPKILTDRPVPKAYWDMRQSEPARAQELLGGKGFSTKKDENGSWMIAEGSSEKVEHDNPADYYNTVLKMACKRALVASVLTATAASDIFTQDVEEIAENMRVSATEPPSDATPAVKVAPTATGEPTKPVLNINGMTNTNGVLFNDYKVINSKADAKKAWRLFVCMFDLPDGGGMEASTFDTKIGEQLDVLKGVHVDICHKPGRKEGTLELISIQPADDNVPF